MRSRLEGAEPLTDDEREGAYAELLDSCLADALRAHEHGDQDRLDYLIKRAGLIRIEYHSVRRLAETKALQTAVRENEGLKSTSAYSFDQEIEYEDGKGSPDDV